MKLVMPWFVCAMLVLATQAGWAADAEDDDYVPHVWREMDVQLPPFPERGNLVPLYVSAATVNRFYIDRQSVDVGADGVIRYAMVVETPSGVSNVTFEGMRCETKSWRLYASGRRDGTWAKSRNETWFPIQEAAVNRQHAVLFLEYFCPFGNPVQSTAEARAAVVQGGHPDVRRR